MFIGKSNLDKVSGEDFADLGMMALDAALSADRPNPRSPAFAVQAIFDITSTHQDKNQIFTSRKNFLAEFSSLEIGLYKGLLSWDAEHSCWRLGDGLTVDTKSIKSDVVRWYVNGWDFSRHTRDGEFTYPEDAEFAPFGEGVDRLFYALMPLEDELTRRIFFEWQTNRIGYCDVYKSNETEMFQAEIGFFDDRRTHCIRFGEQPFWRMEGITVPALLRKYSVMSYRVHHISDRRSNLR